jgi:hypothetical protein
MTNMNAWQMPDWKIVPHYVFSLEVSVAPPAPLTRLEDFECKEHSISGEFILFSSKDQLEEDRGDLEFGLITKSRYGKEGVKGFTEYSKYRTKKLRE